jgi:cyclophilin family peptidyl-prolyl cis-trans isomerase
VKQFFSPLLVFLLSFSLLLSATLNAKEKLTTEQQVFKKILELVDQRQLELIFFQNTLSKGSIENKISALKGLGRIGGDAIITLITPYLTHKNEKVRRATVFAFGISAPSQLRYLQVSDLLWQQLSTEKNETVKQEIYLALAGLGDKPNQNHLVLKMLSQVEVEKQSLTKASIFQALSMALTIHPKMTINAKKSQTDINFHDLLKLFERDDEVSYAVGYFLARIENIHLQLNPSELHKFIELTKTINNKKMLARLIGKITKKKHLANRSLLSWLILQSEQNDISLATESIRAMKPLLYIPQAKIQLGKLTISSNMQVAQTALNILAHSNLTGAHIIGTLKKQLENKNSGMVVEAMAGLIKRQDREDMSWAVKILAHKSTYVKMHFSQLIADKDKKRFIHVLKMLSKDTDLSVAAHAKSLINANQAPLIQNKLPTTDYQQVIKAIGSMVLLHTTSGDIKIKMNAEALYTSANFVRLIKQGFYNGSYFSRVIGNFVTQGGDTVGHGDGSSGELIREEISYLSHLIGTVGVATNGKDTGDSQFFINVGDNIHLDRRYTIFGNVVDGMENVVQLNNSSQIISAEIVH